MMYTPGLWLFFLSSALQIVLIAKTASMVYTSLGRACLMLFSACFLWTAAFIGESAAQALPLKILFVQLQFIAICFLPAIWLYLTLTFIGKHFRWPFWAGVCLIPAAVLVVLIGSAPPNWFWGFPAIISSHPPFQVMNYDYRWLYSWVLMPYTYILFGSTVLLLIQSAVFMQRIYRSQARLLLGAVILPLVVNLLYNFGISPVAHYT